MSDERMIRALERLEQAVLRADAASGAAVADRDSLREELDRLESRHRRLRASAASAIERLDALVASAAPEASEAEGDG